LSICWDAWVTLAVSIIVIKISMYFFGFMALRHFFTRLCNFFDRNLWQIIYKKDSFNSRPKFPEKVEVGRDRGRRRRRRRQCRRASPSRRVRPKAGRGRLLLAAPHRTSTALQLRGACLCSNPFSQGSITIFCYFTTFLQNINFEQKTPIFAKKNLAKIF
jgi:hypothetical protein